MCIYSIVSSCVPVLIVLCVALLLVVHMFSVLCFMWRACVYCAAFVFPAVRLSLLCCTFAVLCLVCAGGSEYRRVKQLLTN